MELINIDPGEVISMNDYPPLHSPTALRKYHDIFRNDNQDMVTPIPMIPVSVAVPYFQRHNDKFRAYSKELYEFLKNHSDAEYFMLDGTHRATGAMLSSKQIPAYRIKNNKDVKELFSLRKEGKISIYGLSNNLAKTVDILETHYHKHKKFWTLKEKVNLMISNGDIDSDPRIIT